MLTVIVYSAGLAKVALLHQKWVRSHPRGALSSECQELNALHSQSVDGARIKIPDRLLTPPPTETPYIIDLLGDAAAEFSARFLQSQISSDSSLIVDQKVANDLITALLCSEQNALSEYEIFSLALSISRKHSIDFRPYLVHVNFGALTSQQKYALISAAQLDSEYDALIWNSLLRSDILVPSDLQQRRLNGVLPFQRLYASSINGLGTFFQFLHIATQDFTRKLLVMKVCLTF